MAEIVTEKVSVTTTGSAGSATGSSTSEVMEGELLDVYLDFHASAPATTDTTVAFADRGGNILVVTDSKTDALFAPRVKPVDNANAAITNAHDRFGLNGALTVSLAGADALTGAVLAYRRYGRVLCEGLL